MDINETTCVRRVRKLQRRKRDSIFDQLLTRLVITLMHLSHFWLTHVTLVTLLVLYTVGGAYLFQGIESKAALVKREKMRQHRDTLLHHFWNGCRAENVSEDKWSKEVRNQMIGHHAEICSPIIWSNVDTSPWSLSRSVFFCGSVYTTIGYGNIYPMTSTGQMVTMLYALLGIPLLLIVLADIGSFMTTVLRKVYFLSYKLWYSRLCCCCRLHCPCCSDGNSYSCSCKRQNTVNSTESSNASNGEGTSVKHLQSPSYRIGDGCQVTVNGYEGPFLDQEDFVVPIWVGLVIIIIYMLIGAWFFQRTETWSYREALYFTFLSLTTIGFGDYLPSHMSYAVILIYFLLGLALVSMFFNLAVDRVSDAVRKARNKLTRKLTKVVIYSKERIETRLEEEDMLEFRRSWSDNSDESGDTGHSFPIHIFESMPFSYQDEIDSSTGFSKKTSGISEPIILLQVSDSRLLHYVRRSRPRSNGANNLQLQISELHMMQYMEERLNRSKNTAAITEDLSLVKPPDEDLLTSSKSENPQRFSISSISHAASI